MRYIPLPEDVELISITGEQVVDRNGQPMVGKFANFVRGRLTDQAFTKTMDAVQAAVHIRQSIEKIEKNTNIKYLAVETADWPILVESVKNPGAPYDARIGHCYFPHMEAITNATETVPEDYQDNPPPPDAN
jgi:hypothetical protein